MAEPKSIIFISVFLILLYNKLFLLKLGIFLGNLIILSKSELTKRIFGRDAQISCVSAMTNYYINNAPSNKKHLFYKKDNKSTSFNISDYIKAN